MGYINRAILQVFYPHLRHRAQDLNPSHLFEHLSFKPLVICNTMSDDKIGTPEHQDFAGEQNGNFDRSWRDEKWDGKALQQEAAEVFVDEKELGPREALKAYPMAVVWSLVMATCVIMEGYDTNLMGNFFAYRKYCLR